MALTVATRGTGTHNTGATTLAPGGRSATIAAGSMGVLCIAADNQGSGGASTMGPATATDSKGNVWTRRVDALYDNGAASAGIEMMIYTGEITVAFLTSDTLTLTWVGGVSPVAKSFTWYEVTAATNAEVEYSTGGNIAGATAANAQVVTGSVPVGDAVIAGYFAEGVSAVTQDADATNGSWAAQQTTTIGATTSGVRIATQSKVQTTTASTQSYDVTVSSQDRIAGWIVLHEGRTADLALLLKGGGVATAGAQKGATLGVAATGGGVTTSVGQKNGLRAVALTGGGAIASPGQKGGTLAAALTGGGITTIGALAEFGERHDGSFAATGGGTTVPGITTARSGASTLTGGGAVTEAGTTDRSSGVTLTGAGAVTQAARKASESSLALTGGGAVTASVLAARMGAALLSGGGVFSSLSSTQRSGAAALTGGGAVVVVGTLAEDHAGSFDLTGGGAVALGRASARMTAVHLAGGGSVLVGAQHAAALALLLTGAGRVTLAGDAPRDGSFVITGGGRTIIFAGDPPVPLPDGFTVDVGLSSVPGMGVSINAPAASVAFAADRPVEVVIS